jgi:uncharacterized protein (DUF305 family)
MPALRSLHTLQRAGALTGALIGALAVAACSDQRVPTGPAAASLARAVDAAAGPAPTTQQARYEIDFMTDMIDHHMMAVMMSQVCLQKAVHEELRALCAQIIATQQAEIAQMQAWLQAWYGITYEPEMKPGAMRQVERLAALSPAEFEIEFMKRMIRHHAMAVREGEHCLGRAYHAELLHMCHNIVQTQRQEIDLMQSWLCAWYGICHYYSGL